MSQNLPKRCLRDFLSWRRSNHFVLLGANNETSSLPTDSSRPLFKQIEIFSGILTVYFNCKYFFKYTRELLECLLGISPSARNPCGGNYYCGREEEPAILIVQAVITLALHGCCQPLFGLPLRMNGMHWTQFDHACFDLLPLVIWSRVFWPSVTWNLRKAQLHRGAKAFWSSIVVARTQYPLVITSYYLLRATKGACNPNFPADITHALHVCSQYFFGLPQRMNGMHKHNFLTSTPRTLIRLVLTICQGKLAQSTALEQKRLDLWSLSSALPNLWYH